jgi:hypothetical protein
MKCLKWISKDKPLLSLLYSSFYPLPEQHHHDREQIHQNYFTFTALEMRYMRLLNLAAYCIALPGRLGRMGMWIGFACCLLGMITPAGAQQVREKPARILFLLDASGSMNQKWEKQETRFEAASRIILTIMDSIYRVNNEVAFAVRVFGEQYPAAEKNCYDSRLEVPFGYQNRPQVQTRLHYLHPKGFSPIAWSLQETAENDFVQSDQYAYSIILITDGGESCGGDICATVKNLLSKKISFRPYILSLIHYAPMKEQYDCLGTLLTVATEPEISPAIKKIIEDNRKILEVKVMGLKSLSPEPAKKTIPIRKVPLPEIKLAEEATPKQEPRLPKPEPAWQRPALPELGSIPVIRSLKKLNLLYSLSSVDRVSLRRLPSIRLKPGPEVAALPPPPPAKQAPKTAAPAMTKQEKVVFSVQNEDAAETTLQVYFTNGTGTFYRTEPLMKILDSKTHKEVKSVYRNMAGAEPSPIKIAAGTYDIVIPGSNATAENVQLTEHKSNKVYIKAGRASLAFYYVKNRNRPVKEYQALVSKRFEGGAVVKQQCSEALSYDPTNYHVEINTLPILIYNVDLNFNEVKLVAIPEPGTLQVLNENNMGRVQFWCQRGDSFVPFYEMDVQGHPTMQHIDLLPGNYQVRYFKQPRQPYQKAEVYLFKVASAKTTNITLTP